MNEGIGTGSTGMVYAPCGVHVKGISAELADNAAECNNTAVLPGSGVLQMILSYTSKACSRWLLCTWVGTHVRGAF